MATPPVQTQGLTDLVAALKQVQSKEINRELRTYAKLIAQDIVPLVEGGVRSSGAPQAAAFAKTVRVHSDRVPVIVVGKVDPKFAGKRKFRHPGESTAWKKRRRGSMAAGVVNGGKGGRRSTPWAEDYYHIPRSETWGALGRALKDGGPIIDRAEELYLRFFVVATRRAGLNIER